MRLNNFEMENRLQSLEPALKCKGKLGFVAAKNARKIADELTEYVERKNALIAEYGETGDDGRTFVNTESDRAPQFLQELTAIGVIECNVDVHTVTVADILDQLTGEQMAGIAWMVSDWDEEG